jgi:hypothetical protein
MKKLALTMVSLILFGGIIFISSCDKTDLNAPVITLVGDAEVTLDLGATWVDPGCTATDAEDGVITTGFTKTGTVNTDQCNTYTITYTVADKAGNVSNEVTRTVKVKSDLLTGSYHVHDVVTIGPGAGTYDYDVTVTQSGIDYNKLLINNFGGFGGTTIVSAYVLAANISIPVQTPVMPVGDEGSFTGTGGTYTVSTGLKAVATINYVLDYTATGVLDDHGAATYTKF